MSDKATFPSLMIRIVMTFCVLACCSIFKEQAASQTNRIEQKTQEQEKSADASCLADDKPKPDVIFRLGILNGKAMKMPKPKYPVEAKRKGITGEVKVEVVININTGVIEWAKLLTGDPLLQEAVSKVICQARFFPTDDVDSRASGYLIYKFHSPRKTAYSGLHLDEQIECSRSETISLTPRLIAVKSEGIEPETVSTVFLPAQMSISTTSARLTTSRRIAEERNCYSSLSFAAVLHRDQSRC